MKTKEDNLYRYSKKNMLDINQYDEIRKIWRNYREYHNCGGWADEIKVKIEYDTHQASWVDYVIFGATLITIIILL